MNKEIIWNELNWLFEAITEQFEEIRSHGEKIPQIEFDILMENVRKFYQDMRTLQRLDDPVSAAEKMMAGITPAAMATPVSRDTAGQPAVQERVPAAPEIQVPRVTVSFSDPEPEELIPPTPEEPAPEPVTPIPVQFKPAGPGYVKQEAPAAARKPGKSPEPDLFASEEPTFSIRLRTARETTLGPKSPPEKIDNLKTAITINEKFMFINELFDGNLREYNETVETLNGFMTLDQAAGYLDLMRKKNFWNTGSNAFKKLTELVERRF